MKGFFSALENKNGEIPVSTFLMYALVIIGMFFVVREVITWYYKINRIVELLESIDEKLGKSLEPPSGNNVKIADASKAPIGSVAIDLDSVQSSQVQPVKSEVPISTRVKDVLTKEYHVRDLFSNKEDNDN